MLARVGKGAGSACSSGSAFGLYPDWNLAREVFTTSLCNRWRCFKLKNRSSSQKKLRSNICSDIWHLHRDKCFVMELLGETSLILAKERSSSANQVQFYWLMEKWTWKCAKNPKCWTRFPIWLSTSAMLNASPATLGWLRPLTSTPVKCSGCATAPSWLWSVTSAVTACGCINSSGNPSSIQG